MVGGIAMGAGESGEFRGWSWRRSAEREEGQENAQVGGGQKQRWGGGAEGR